MDLPQAAETPGTDGKNIERTCNDIGRNYKGAIQRIMASSMRHLNVCQKATYNISMKITRAIVTLYYALLLCVTATAADIDLAWDHSLSEGVLGYNIYYGLSSGVYTAHVNVPYQTTWTLTGLGPGTWFIAATAFDSESESEYSNEVSAIITQVVSCDVNGDASINILDQQALTNLILYGPADLLFDLNQDGSLNVLDLQILSNVILGQRTCP